MAGKGRKALQKGEGGVRKPSSRDGMGRQALQVGQEGSGGPAIVPESAGRPS